MSLLPKGGAWQALTLRHAPWPPCLVAAPRHDPLQLVEEEKTPYYHPDSFFPARLGQVLNGRYQLATKLGYGSSSTVWLARDLRGSVCLDL
jgi:serine/threonine-protein kinase SRPK3